MPGRQGVHDHPPDRVEPTDDAVERRERDLGAAAARVAAAVAHPGAGEAAGAQQPSPTALDTPGYGDGYLPGTHRLDPRCDMAHDPSTSVRAGAAGPAR